MGWVPHLAKHVGASERARHRPPTQSGRRRGRLSRAIAAARARVACYPPRLTVESHRFGEVTSPPVTALFLQVVFATADAHIVGRRLSTREPTFSVDPVKRERQQPRSNDPRQPRNVRRWARHQPTCWSAAAHRPRPVGRSSPARCGCQYGGLPTTATWMPAIQRVRQRPAQRGQSAP